MQLPQASGGAVAGDRLFTLERPAGAEQFRLVVRSADDPLAAPRVLLDPAVESADGAAAIDWYQPSRDGDLVAFGVSEGGTESSALRVLRGQHAEHCSPTSSPTAGPLRWPGFPVATGFWYTRYPEGDEYNRAVWFHRLGAPVESDELLWHDTERAETWPSVSCSPDGAFVLVHAMMGWTNIDVHLFEVATKTWRPVSVGEQVPSSLDFGGDGLIGVTMLGAPCGRLITVAPR